MASIIHEGFGFNWRNMARTTAVVGMLSLGAGGVAKVGSDAFADRCASGADIVQTATPDVLCELNDDARQFVANAVTGLNIIGAQTELVPVRIS